MTDPSNWNKGCKPRFNKTCSASQQPMTFMEIPHVDFYSYNKIKGEGKCYTKAALLNGYKSPKVRVTTYLKAPLCLETFEYTIPNGTGLTCSTKGPKPVTSFSSMYAAKVKRMKWAYLYWFAFVIGAIEMIFIVSGSWLLFKRHDVSDVVKEGYRVIASQFTKFSYFELKKATSNFKEELGKGASGAVFKGVLADERVVAVKKLGDAYLSEECRHRLLDYEYVENQSLDQHLFSSNVIGWKERFKVALGTAKGLAYLHHECLEWAIHCDVKPENILLDGEFEPKILDFGLAKLSQRDRKNPEFSLVILELVKGNRLSNWVLEDGEQQETEVTKFLRDIKRKIQSEE
ncbi:hypothetical protein Gorai_004553, partial [Gossypium raimondii]|nr:hypothetical protein [Gossypium raimondii]